MSESPYTTNYLLHKFAGTPQHFTTLTELAKLFMELSDESDCNRFYFTLDHVRGDDSCSIHFRRCKTLNSDSKSKNGWYSISQSEHMVHFNTGTLISEEAVVTLLAEFMQAHNRYVMLTIAELSRKSLLFFNLPHSLEEE